MTIHVDSTSASSAALADLADPGLAMKCRRLAGWLAVLFFLAHLPALPSLAHWRGDEKFYTDAAVRMHQSGNYLSPQTDEGQPRFKKPIVTYWAVLGGYRVFGFNYLGSRIAFLLAGALVVWLSFEVGLALTQLPREALVTAAVVGSNLTLHNVSIRSTPDALVCLFLLMSLLGFIRLLFREPSPGAYAVAYFGAALAIATKGLLGMLPVLYAFSFCLVTRRTRRAAWSLFHPLIVPAAAVVAGAWYAWAFMEHGNDATSDFLGDQVGSRLTGGAANLGSNAAVYLSSFASQLLPWSLLAGIAAWSQRTKLGDLWRSQRGPLLFAFGWVLLLFVVFTPANIQRTRYFLPAYPFLGVVFALLLLRETAAGRTWGSWTDWARLGVWLGGGMALLLAWPARALGPGAMMALVVVGVAGVGCGVLMRKAPPAVGAFHLAAFIIFVLAADLLLLTPTLRASPADEITRRLLVLPPEAGPLRLPVAGTDAGYPSQVRALSGGRIEPYLITIAEADQELAAAGRLLCTEKVLRKWNPANADAQPCGTGSLPWRSRDFFKLLRAGDPAQFRQSKLVPFYLVTSRAAPARTQPTASE